MNLLVEITKFLIYSIFIVLIAKYILVKILRKLGELLELKPKVIGNIAGIATSIPEFLTVSFSALTGLIATSTYNVISSNIINWLQYTISVIINKNQKVIRNQAIKIDLGLVAITIFVPIIMIIFHVEHNLILIPIFIILLFLGYKLSNNAHKLYMKKQEEDKKQEDIYKTVENSVAKRYFYVFIYGVFLVLVGIALYIIGNLLSEVLENLCITFHIPEIIVGILLGFITSLPELITFFESQKHHKDEKEGVVEATSNLLTSNMMNLYVIQSIGILIYTIVT